MAQNSGGEIAVEETTVKEEQENKCGDAELAGFQDQVAISHPIVQLFLSPVELERLFLTIFIDNGVKTVQTPKRVFKELFCACEVIQDRH
jgi:hypothetical protein